MKITITKKEKIPGGLGKDLHGSMEQQHQQIADMHNTDVEQIDTEVSKGIEVEMEHTSDEEIAHEIAMDHVIEDPEYYTKLSKTELEEKKKKAGTESSKESNLRDWFKRKGEKGSKGGWVDCNAPDGKGGYKACGREEGEKRKKYPACRPTPGACKEQGRGKTWGKKGSKKNESLRFTNEELKKIAAEELQAVLDEAEGKKDACYHKVKARYDVWPSAYASGALSKCRKVGAKNWGNKSKKNEDIQEEKRDCFANKTFDGKVKCIMKEKNISEERASAYVASVLRKKGELKENISESLRYHLDHGVGVEKNVFRPGSNEFFNIIKEARTLYESGKYTPHTDEEKEILESELGEHAVFKTEVVPLDFPMLNEEKLDEEKDPPIGKPMKNSGGGKKYKVYVRNPKTGKVKKITYGDSKGGLKGNWNNAEARKSFAARHNCEDKKDRTKAGYWACRAHKDFGTNVPGRFW
jgi:hypothetical protein